MEEKLKTSESKRSEDDLESSSCSTSGGACWTGPRMCPGFALLGGWLFAYPILFFTGSKNASLIVMFVIAGALMMGLHSKLWRSIQSRKG